MYELYDRLTTAFPEILFESCAGGGGRFDPGLLAFAPQAWTSDDTDAIERLKIQWGTSLAYPVSSMAAHVSAVPNHQVGRITPLATRAAVAFFGVLGYELDPTTLTAEERRQVADQVAFYVSQREVLQYGRFVRLRSPFEGDGNDDCVDERLAGPAARGRRLLPGAQRAGARRRPGSPAGARPGAGLPRVGLAGRSTIRSREPTRSSAAATTSCTRACSSRPERRRPPPAATSGRASSSSTRR